MNTVPCVRCGAPVAGPVGARCTRCEPPSLWTIQVGPERLTLGRDELRKRLEAGTVAGTDHVLDGGNTMPVAAHPAFRAWFLAGHPDALTLPERRRRWWMFGLG